MKRRTVNSVTDLFRLRDFRRDARNRRPTKLGVEHLESREVPAGLAVGTPYTQDFNSLATAGTATWTDGVTIDGWYASQAAYTASDGTGVSTGGAARVNVSTGGSQSGPSIGMAADGRFVVA